MRKRKLTYREGTWFAVPLGCGGYGIGVVARLDGAGGLFGYFFGPKRATLPTLKEVLHLRPRESVCRLRYGDLGFIRKEWPIIGDDEDWCREEWPLPDFVRIDLLSPEKAYKTVYSDSLKALSQELCDPQLARTHPEDSLYGYKAVDIYLTDLLSK